MTVIDEAAGGAAFDFNPLVSPHREDPHLFYREARTRPVTLSPTLGAYMVSRYTDVVAVLHDTETFSSAAAIPLLYENPPEVVDMLRAGSVPEADFILNQDGAAHRRTRAVFDAGVVGRRVRALLPVMRERADELLDRLAGAGEADLAGEYAAPYVDTVINALIGFPARDAMRIRAWTDDLLTLMNPLAPLEARVAAAHAAGEYTRYLQVLIDDRRTTPGDDLISALLHGTDRLDGLSDAQVHTIARGTRIAGFDTTRDLITASVLVALEHQEVADGVAADPTRTIPRAAEETLRRDAPHRGLFRVTTREVELGGTTLPRGARLLLLFGSANRDEAVFPDPDTVFLGRPNVHEHLGFGKGAHVCPGAPLARAEARVALQALFARLPGLRLADDHRPEYVASYFFRSLASLRVRW